MQGPHDITWRNDAVPVSTLFDDPFYSLDNGLAETNHVFLAGNDLPARFCDGFHVAELGFGTGLNLVATLAAWETRGAPGRFRFTSFEAFPLAPETVAVALAPFEDARPFVDQIAAALAGGSGTTRLGACDLHLIFGDARETLPAWDGRADAWYLDGFSPAKNPELWEHALLGEVALHTAQGGTCATYSAAGTVRRGLSDAGFTVERVPGYGRKRHMTVGRLP